MIATAFQGRHLFTFVETRRKLWPVIEKLVENLNFVDVAVENETKNNL